MISIQVNEVSQNLDFSESGGLLCSLSYAEATRNGIRCLVDYIFVDGPDGEVTQKNQAPSPDISKLSAEHSKMDVTTRDGRTSPVPCVQLLKSGKKILDIMLPFELE